MKYELGDWTNRLSLCCFCSNSAEGLRRSTARVWRTVRARFNIQSAVGSNVPWWRDGERYFSVEMKTSEGAAKRSVVGSNLGFASEFKNAERHPGKEVAEKWQDRLSIGCRDDEDKSPRTNAFILYSDFM